MFFCFCNLKAPKRGGKAPVAASKKKPVTIFPNGLIFIFIIFSIFQIIVIGVFRCVFLGESGEPAVREASEAVWDRRCIASEKGSNPIREMAQDCSNSEEEEDPQAEVEGPTSFEPVYQDP